ncbi:hypothetical protein EOD39_17688 [Acipenser ruthenus]|uniref:Uncharacterized protein n=1 Tax=Acipenser ruthenus TaxID=7906 RepID=A0A444U6E9_ACIRT|nr:hypothetical protein EOD39_17688 [Acipenser ruthenus]
MGSPVMKALARATTAKVKDSASERTYNSPVIPYEDLEQNDTEEENSTPSTASASEVPVRVDWSVNSVDSSSLDDQPRVQFALDFSQRSQEFQIHISQCKNLDRVEVCADFQPRKRLERVSGLPYILPGRARPSAAWEPGIPPPPAVTEPAHALCSAAEATPAQPLSLSRAKRVKRSRQAWDIMDLKAQMAQVSASGWLTQGPCLP